MIARAEKRLEYLQTLRKAREATEEAELLLRHSLIKQDNPASVRPQEIIEVNGFVFSASKVLAQLNRKLALAAARFHQENGWDPKRAFPRAQSLSFLTPNPLPKAA